MRGALTPPEWKHRKLIENTLVMNEQAQVGSYGVW